MGGAIRVLSLFSGIGAFEKALERLGVEHEIVNYCELDRHASKAYSIIHGVPETLNLGDITKVDADSLPKDIDLVTYGFPCQDISSAGLRRGFEHEGKATRSGLFFEALRIIEAVKPRYAIAENVKNLTSKKFKTQFQTVLSSLENVGYNNYWKVLNAKDFGVPQNRERVFIVSRRKGEGGFFDYPEGFPLERRLKDVLETNVDDRYYLSDRFLNSFVARMRRRKGDSYDFKNILDEGEPFCGTIITSAVQKTSPYIKVRQIGNVCPTSTRENPNQGRVYDSNGLSPALNCMEGGNRQPFIVDDLYKSRGERIYHYECPTLRSANHGFKVYEPFIVASRGRNPTDPSDRTPGAYVEQTLDPNSQGVSNALTTVQKDNYLCEPIALDEQNGYLRKDGCVGTLTIDGSSPKHNNRVVQSDFRIRKLIPKECFRLMGFDDADVDVLVSNGISDSQLYKMAGNSIVVDVLEALFKSLFGLEGKREQPLLEGWG